MPRCLDVCSGCSSEDLTWDGAIWSVEKWFQKQITHTITREVDATVVSQAGIEQDHAKAVRESSRITMPSSDRDDWASQL